MQKDPGKFLWKLVGNDPDAIFKPFILSDANKEFTSEVYNDPKLFQAFIDKSLQDAGADFLYGGYNEKRDMYRRSELFEAANAGTSLHRNIHLGLDIWGPAGTTVMAPVAGTVHSFKFNDNHGDYGATIILEHIHQEQTFYTLYGHLALADLQNLFKRKIIAQGEAFAHFGPPAENGNWPPHLHFQVINNMQEFSGDYPGVCTEEDKNKYLENCIDPLDLLFATL